ncbi:hypothetical protein ONR75_15870 [Rhodopseudomonas sp. P2A-2r]|uniref:hypothetical protein n=1 Tax=Rhodopseudomonas sp. P2A-2r TaxID=2991972 RepID=UPI0022344963|nr:hypothetical protein [Rhodopseudomonas sp. P2A-2r]UZE51908.1 hypothetical protein ONR75_15870 [Rhodopseudomonas sp. P2A-2r]
MTTGIPGTTARKMTGQLVHYLRFKVAFGDAATAVALLKQTLPLGAIILRASLVKTTAWNSATSAALSVGLVGGTGAELISAADVKTATGLVAGTLSAGALAPLTADTQVQASVAFVGAPTAGAAYVVIEYVNDNDLNVGQ